MASLRKRGDKWYVEVCCKGKRRSATFLTKTEANAWASHTESSILRGKDSTIPDKTFKDLLERYRDEVTAKKENDKWDRLRLDLLARDTLLSDVKLDVISAPDIAAWRERRLKTVGDGTVIRELGLLSSACTYAISNWKWLEINPCKGVTRPKDPTPRTRRPSADEISAILHSSGYYPTSELLQITARVGAMFLFAIETAMRAGEMCNLTWVDVHDDYAHLPKTKNEEPRDVALSPEAHRLLAQLRHIDPVRCFKLKSSQVDSIFRKIKLRCNIEDLRFHDTRREALTRLSKKLDVMELARMSGHKDLKILFKVYYAPDVADTTKKLQ